MPIISELQILKNLQEQNEWWVSKSIRPELVPPMKRNAYERVKFVFLNEIRRFPILSGARRVGKSTIMFQLIDELLQSGIQPERILFYTLDDFPNDEVSVKEAVRVYQKYVYTQDDFYLFIDEAQKDKSWKSFAKQLFDLHKNVRAIISGSSSVEIEQNSDESGSARFLTIKIPTLSFYEYCVLNNKKLDIQDVSVFKMHTLPLDSQTKIYASLATLQSEFMRYLKIGGFPEYAKLDQDRYALKLIRDQIVTKAIRQDIPKSYPIRDVDSLSNLYAYFCYHSAEIANIDTISSALKLDRATCNQYIHALEKANLLYLSEQLDLSGKKALKPKNKVYVSDYSIRCAVTRNYDIETNEAELGLAIETMSYKHTYDYFMSIDQELYAVGYSKVSKDKEIDIVIKEQQIDIQYVEAKYRHQSHIKDDDAIVVYGLKETPGYVITKEADDWGMDNRDNTSLYRIPAIAYFYLLGKYTK